MPPSRVVLAAAALTPALVGGALAADPPAIKAPPQIYGSIDARGAVALKDAKGRPVLRLRRGSYTLTVQDLTRARAFRLVGPGVTRATGARFRGAVIWGVTLRKGVYRLTGTPGGASARVVRVR